MQKIHAPIFGQGNQPNEGFMKNNKGFTLVEVSVATLLGALVTYAAISYITYLSGLNSRMTLRRIAANTIHSYTENIRYNLSLYQVSFDNSLEKENELLDFKNLPLAISDSTVVPRTECAKVGCQAYFGYIIIPSEFVRNLYQVKMRIWNASGKEGQGWDQTYFITTR